MPRRSLGIMRRRFTYQGSKPNVDALHTRAAIRHKGLSELFDKYTEVIDLLEQAARTGGSIEVHSNGPIEIAVIWKSGTEEKAVVL